MALLWWERLLDFVMPQRCAGCGEFPRPLLCGDCVARLRPVAPPYCQCCGQPFSPLAHHAPVCARCRQHPPAFKGARSLFLYQEPLRTAIHRFKFHRLHALAAPLGRLLVAGLEGPLQQEPALETVAALVPVPLHPWRQRRRGFNQSELLARVVGRHFDRPVQTRWLRRVRHTTPQVGLTADQRRRNMRGAFEAHLHGDISPGHVLLIDDLYTTGSTLHACARALRRAGVETVWALTLARAANP